jgi:predicted dehydrogenase
MCNLAIISTAHIHTDSYLKEIAGAADGRKIAAIWDDVVERGQRYAAKYNAPFFADLAEVLADPKIDGFIICSENTRHLRLLEKIISLGKPIFCEKPLATTAEDVDAIEKLLAASPAPLFCGYFMPWHGDLQQVRRMIAENAFGKIYRVRFRNAHTAAFGRWFDKPDLAWFAEPKLSGGGALIDLGTHAVHVVRTLFGKAGNVWATVRSESGEYPKVDDYGLIEIRFISGVLGTVEAAWTQNGGYNGLEIVGRDASLWNTADGYVWNPQGKIEKLPLAPARETRVERLVSIVRGKISQEEIAADLAATIDAVRIMAAAYQSAQMGHWVTL